jgi:predicted RNase H-like HicB family nuclease
MTNYFPVVIEKESNGTFSAWIAGLPGVYAAGDTRAKAKSAIRAAAVAHLQALKRLGQPIKSNADVLLLKGDLDRADADLEFTGFAAMLGRKRSMAKARAARVNGRKGGRPRVSTTAR